MELNGIVQSLRNKIIFIAGSTGFLSKLFIEKLPRVQPDVKHLFLLLRANDASSPTQRLNKDVTEKELFKVLREEHGIGFDSFISKKVTPVFGDVGLENLGIEHSDMEEKMYKNINIVVNFAATTNFDERYDVALAVNTLGAKHVLKFAEKCENIEMIVHVSTAFVCTGGTNGVILEKPLSQTLKESLKFLNIIEEETKLIKKRLDELKAEQVSEKQETVAMKKFGLERAKLYGWPNTYAFTKALGEIIIGRHLKRNFPVVIVRPTGVTSTYKEPFLGWIECFNVGREKLPCFLGDYDSFFDIIPGDMVVNAIIVAMMNHTKINNRILSNDDDDIIYHICSSAHKEPTKIIKLLGYAYDYFCENPLVSGAIVNPIFFPTMSSFQWHVYNNYMLTMKEENVQFAKRLAETYEPYLLFKGTFNSSASDLLRMWKKEHYGSEEVDIFDFNTEQIDWKNYMINIHIPGLVKYIVKPYKKYTSKL